MKRILSICLITLFLGYATTSLAQDEDKSVKKEVKKGAKKVGNKSAEVASKGKAKITDAKHKDKVGPNGQTIYIDNHAKFYWVDKKGRRHYVNEAQLKDKVD
ncbi:MAG: hypothetical protein ACXWCG_07765 [Flavitalea sp.]